MGILMGGLLVVGLLTVAWILDATARSWNMPVEQHEEVAHDQGTALVLLVVVAAVSIALLAV